jgi:hypothetical protein
MRDLGRAVLDHEEPPPHRRAIRRRTAATKKDRVRTIVRPLPSTKTQRVLATRVLLRHRRCGGRNFSVVLKSITELAVGEAAKRVAAGQVASIRTPVSKLATSIARACTIVTTSPDLLEACQVRTMWTAGRTAKKVFKQPGAFALAVIYQFRANQGVLLAGAVAYYTLLSLIPLLILILMALSHVNKIPPTACF